MKEKVLIKDDFIKLDSLLKFVGIAESGGISKTLISQGLVKVNGEIETRRGKKIYIGDTIEFNGKEYLVNFVLGSKNYED